MLFISASGAVLLRHVLHDQRLPDDLRVQPRRRDPGLELLVARLTANRVPANAVIVRRPSSARIVTLPALIKVDINGVAGPAGVLRRRLGRGDRALPGVPIPICLRWRTGDEFEAGSWNNGVEVQVDEPVAVAEIVDHLDLLHPAVRPRRRYPFNERLRVEVRQLRADRSPSARCSCSTIWWHVSAKKWFTGPEAHHRRGRRRGVRRLTPVTAVDVELEALLDRIAGPGGAVPRAWPSCPAA